MTRSRQATLFFLFIKNDFSRQKGANIKKSITFADDNTNPIIE